MTVPERGILGWGKGGKVGGQLVQKRHQLDTQGNENLGGWRPLEKSDRARIRSDASNEKSMKGKSISKRKKRIGPQIVDRATPARAVAETRNRS